MSQVAASAPARPFKSTRKAKERPVIRLPDGRIFEPRQRWAHSVGITSKTAAAMGLPTIYAGNVCYVDVAASFEILAARHTRKLADIS